ncbi:hypothetical protein BO94DRAFT_61684 [Aspergillus sclerotioniger CBS 115572]|uniref:Cupin type-2 domain-containing protein n=1 Tax=Aspergillus sclerotioniger CBS 115572 TaxID=1450535 RepID=A0A317WPS4_9EURO|nr:hypothetical protein BO94DRAFT_61684 [Aspergillus sclerotioniger CBS 115572]PWY88035.1 hypothetical protein BO94DRAFT_61684 [Aspergillus sclerotioniger CBS 115572]
MSTSHYTYSVLSQIELPQMADNLPPRSNDTRLVVTGHDEKGSTIIVKDTCNQANPVGDGAFLNPLWSSSDTPAPIEGDEQKVPDFADVSKGSLFGTYDIPPHYKGAMHRTVTLDYIVVLKGQVVLTLEDGKRVTLAEGDTTVQRGTMHSWENESITGLDLFLSCFRRNNLPFITRLWSRTGRSSVHRSIKLTSIL